MATRRCQRLRTDDRRRPVGVWPHEEVTRAVLGGVIRSSTTSDEDVAVPRQRGQKLAERRDRHREGEPSYGEPVSVARSMSWKTVAIGSWSPRIEAAAAPAYRSPADRGRSETNSGRPYPSAVRLASAP